MTKLIAIKVKAVRADMHNSDLHWSVVTGGYPFVIAYSEAASFGYTAHRSRVSAEVQPLQHTQLGIQRPSLQLMALPSATNQQYSPFRSWRITPT